MKNREYRVLVAMAMTASLVMGSLGAVPATAYAKDTQTKTESTAEAGAKVVGTGRSDFPNQVNNVIAFPGIFKGALEGRATQITEEMKLAAALAIANLVPDDELSDTNILPEAFDPRVADVVSQAIKALIK